MDPSQDMADPSAKTVAPWGNTFQKEQRKTESEAKNKRSGKQQREHQGQRRRGKRKRLKRKLRRRRCAVVERYSLQPVED